MIVFPLGGVTTIHGELGRGFGSINFTIGDEDYILLSVPNASIQTFVTVADELRPGAAKRLGQSNGDVPGAPRDFDGSTEHSNSAPLPSVDNPLSSTKLQYRPTPIHGLSPERLARTYAQLGDEIVDFRHFTDWQLSHLSEVMLPGELLIWLADGYLQGSFKDPGDSGSTMIAITDRRLLLLVDPLLATNQHKAFRLTDISAVHRDGGFITGGFRFRESGGGQRKITKMLQASAEATVAKLQAAIDAAHSPKTPPPHVQGSRPSGTDVADQLEKLANLVERGFLTPEEFAEQKAKLLGG